MYTERYNGRYCPALTQVKEALGRGIWGCCGRRKNVARLYGRLPCGTSFYLCVQCWRFAAICHNEPHIGFCKFRSDLPSMILKRACDAVDALIAVLVFAIPMAIVALAGRATSRGPALCWSLRVGRDSCLFSMPKFHTMRIDTPVVTTHLLESAANHLTPIGSFLRKTSLDELPKLSCIRKGAMSFIGPRPALFNQDDLTAARKAQNLHLLLLGLKGCLGPRSRRAGDSRTGRARRQTPRTPKLEFRFAHSWVDRHKGGWRHQRTALMN